MFMRLHFESFLHLPRDVQGHVWRHHSDVRKQFWCRFKVDIYMIKVIKFQHHIHKGLAVISIFRALGSTWTPEHQLKVNSLRRGYSGLAVEPTSWFKSFDSSSRQPQVVAHQHWAFSPTLNYCVVLRRWCCAWLVTIALLVHCGLGQLSPLPTYGDDEWIAAQHCGRAQRSRKSDTHRLRWSLQFR